MKEDRVQVSLLRAIAATKPKKEAKIAIANRAYFQWLKGNLSKAAHTIADGLVAFPADDPIIAAKLQEKFVHQNPISNDRPLLREGEVYPIWRTEEVIQTILRLDDSAASGLTGDSPAMYKALARNSLQSANDITEFLNMHNKLDNDGCPMFHPLVNDLLVNLKYVFLSKTPAQTSAADGFRPIGIEDVLQRVNDKLIATKSLASLGKQLPYNQFGAGVPGGAQTALIAAKLARETHPEWATIRLDATNAFGTMSLNHIIDNMSTMYDNDDTLPLRAFLHRFRSKPLKAVAGSKVAAFIGDGTVQGFAVSPLLYAIDQADAISKASRCLDGHGVIIGLSDNVTIIGEDEHVFNAVKTFKELSLSANIRFNEKSEILDLK